MAFSRKLIDSIWKHTFHVWQCHNDISHGKNDEYSTRDRKLLQEYVLWAYELIKDQVTDGDMWLFREEVRSKVDLSPSQMISWLERVGSCVDVNNANEEIELFIKQLGYTLRSQ